MGIVWEAYYKGVPLLGVPENPIDMLCKVLGGGDTKLKTPARSNQRIPGKTIEKWRISTKKNIDPTFLKQK